MKLYIFYHCPFCVRACMIFGLKNIPITLETIMEGDSATPIRLVGKKGVPILKKDNGSYMNESMDIVHYIDKLYGAEIANKPVDKWVEAWTNALSPAMFKLVVPRFNRLDLPEFATPQARAAAVARETKAFGDLSALIAQTPAFITSLRAPLAEIENRLSVAQRVSSNDFIIYPWLRSLSVVKDLPLGKLTRAYMQDMSEKTKVPLFFDVAI